jgi:hypothetical protein
MRYSGSDIFLPTVAGFPSPVPAAETFIASERDDCVPAQPQKAKFHTANVNQLKAERYLPVLINITRIIPVNFTNFLQAFANETIKI